MQAVLQSIDDGTVVQRSRMTVAEFLDDWLAGQRHRLTATTLAQLRDGGAPRSPEPRRGPAPGADPVADRALLRRPGRHRRRSEAPACRQDHPQHPRRSPQGVGRRGAPRPREQERGVRGTATDRDASRTDDLVLGRAEGVLPCDPGAPPVHGVRRPRHDRHAARRGARSSMVPMSTWTASGSPLCRRWSPWTANHRSRRLRRREAVGSSTSMRRRSRCSVNTDAVDARSGWRPVQAGTVGVTWCSVTSSGGWFTRTGSPGSSAVSLTRPGRGPSAARPATYLCHPCAQGGSSPEGGVGPPRPHDRRHHARPLLACDTGHRSGRGGRRGCPHLRRLIACQPAA